MLICKNKRQRSESSVKCDWISILFFLGFHLCIGFNVKSMHNLDFCLDFEGKFG